ncbi:MAG: S46 family peptidase [Gemmatimonadetes bacterium]|nr:S46 family peptidase [Gemmatimonadota bacterium]
MRPYPAAAIALLATLSGCASPAPAPPAAMPPTPAADEAMPADADGGAEAIDEAAAPSVYDTVQAGAFDNGKMWTFDAPPTEYLESTFGFSPDEEWYARARLGALRIPGCSASLVSATGLVLTNHHCARSFVTQVSEDHENLLDSGFYAATIDEERPLEDFHADQLIEIVDVTGEIQGAVDAAEGAQAQSAVRDSLTEAVAERIREERGGEEAGLQVEVVSFYNGGMYSAYVFRRYEDAKLVMAPELQIGYFGGDPDNFTYPRYSLDFAFLRLYGDDGAPLATGEHFVWSEGGVSAGDLVFVIGNPGSTTRLQTVAELEYRRDVAMPALLGFLDSRIEAIEGYLEGRGDEPGIDDIRNVVFSLLNAQKAYRGMLGGLEDPYIIARRAAAESDFQDALAADSVLGAEHLPLFEEMAALQSRKVEVADESHAFAVLGNPRYESNLIVRALRARGHVAAKAQGASEEDLEAALAGVRSVGSRARELDEALLVARHQDLVDAFGASHPTVVELLGGRTAEEAAAMLISESALSDSASAIAALMDDSLDIEADPGYAFVQGLLAARGPLRDVLSTVGPEEEAISSKLGRARFRLDGTRIPPDATFSLRLADGVVSGYPYNGTVAPAYTTFYGLYDRHHSNPGAAEWDLPGRWSDPPKDFDLSTPINFVSTADVIGGNSGSPVVNRELEVVGLIFDGNIQSLSGDYIYMPVLKRSVAVDVRGILEALEEVYGASRIVEELTMKQGG